MEKPGWTFWPIQNDPWKSNPFPLFSHACVAQLCLTLLRPHGLAPLSMEFSGWEYWSRLSFPTPGDRPKPGIKPSPPALAERFSTTEPPGDPLFSRISTIYHSLLKWYTNPKSVPFSLVFYKVPCKKQQQIKHVCFPPVFYLLSSKFTGLRYSI